jgi:hypothetical protein
MFDYIFVLILILILIFLVLYFAVSSDRLRAWETAHQYRLIDSRFCNLDKGPFTRIR